MNNKQYKKALEEHLQFDGWDLLTTEEVQDLKRELKNDKRNGATALEGFNGRAVILTTEHGTILRSYYTKVAAIADGVFYKTWKGYSATTLKHINEYRTAARLAPLSKKEWIAMPTTTQVIDNNTGEIILGI